MSELELDDLFAEARMASVRVSPDLMARVLTDAAREQPRQETLVRALPAPPGLWARFLSAVGGRGVLAGLSTAAAAGVWIGFAQPAAFSGLTDALLTDIAAQDSVEILPAFVDILAEG